MRSTFYKDNLTNFHGHKSNELSQKATFKTICHNLINITSKYFMDKSQMNFEKGNSSKPYVTLFPFYKKYLKHCHGHKSNYLSQEATFEPFEKVRYCHG